MASPPSGSAPQRPACCGRLCRRREKWKRSDSGIDRVTLRFADPMREKGFADTHKAQLTRYVWLSIGAIVTVGLLVSVTAHRFWDDSQYPTSEARELSQWQMLIFYSSFVFLLLTLAAGLILTKHSVVNTLGLEVLVVSANVCFMMTMAIIPKHYIARAFGHENAEAIWGVDLGPTDGSLVLYIDLVVTSLHLLLPIRWIVLVPLEVIAILVYIVPAVLLGSPAMNFVPFNIIGLMVLTLFAAIGKRSFERQERILFAGLLQEKQKRFQAEFQLSKADNTGVPSKAEGFGSELSVPGTTMSSAAFGDSVGPASLDQIRAIGTREKWFIAKGEVQLLPDRILGQGGFGIVVLGLYHNTMVAVKAPKQEIANKGRISSYLPALCNELRILRHIRHPSIAFLYGASIDVALNKLCLVLEFVDGVPLSKFIRPSADKEGAVESRPGALETMGESSSQSARALIISDILNVLRYLHSRQPAVVHGDLKVSNVFVEERRSRSGQSSYHAKLLDFGLSRILTRSARPLGGTPRWMAPELLAGPRES
ncbi:unnamed protein product [Prorocentrum cordatum]|uniref:Protein kinase domain-containing protein n=1 Tax=Prorocentrum cordatum TaxID=2364126 RepID=A0ABN9REG8_9DINO|nr:unnamed protein product [Polarella glacialis]CAK0816983.1 unnamed protein product [Polarella glacialis]